jgi:hypothetical protein
MNRLLVGVVVLMAACSSGPPASMPTLTFLMCGECVNTPRMRANVDAALAALGLPLDYVVVDLDTLAKTDARSGYPTPTLLIGIVMCSGCRSRRRRYQNRADGFTRTEFRPSMTCAPPSAMGFTSPAERLQQKA